MQYKTLESFNRFWDTVDIVYGSVGLEDILGKHTTMMFENRMNTICINTAKIKLMMAILQRNRTKYKCISARFKFFIAMVQ